MTPSAVFKITPGIQSYAWGKKGSSSLAAQLAEKSISGFTVQDDEAYAESWMGTHPTLPSKVDGQSLIDVLKANPALIGSNVAHTFTDAKEGSSPFLFKVLSIGTALSIQAHPSKKLAERLHRERGDVYKDPNHKPEMAIALTPFTAFLNFLPLPTLLLNLLSVPELEALIPAQSTSELARSLQLPEDRPPQPAHYVSKSNDEPSEEQKAILKKIFAALMSAKEEEFSKVIQSLSDRYGRGEVHECERDLVESVKTLNEQYPGDIGVSCVFILNVVELHPGEAAFLGADMPHAYISGDIIECMAQSDNVVRAGSTPKSRDVETLVEMLTYESGPGSKQLLKPQTISDHTLSYDPPIDEFSVYKIESQQGKEENRPIDGPSSSVVTAGRGSVRCGDHAVEVEKGDVLFIGAGEVATWETEQGSQVFRAYVEAK